MKAGFFVIKLLLLTLLTTACASNWTWDLVSNDNNQLDLAELSMQLPENWVIYNKHFNKYIARTEDGYKEEIVKQSILSKSGLELDIIRIISFNSKYAFPSIGQSAGVNVLPSELAERFIAEQKAVADSVRLEVLKSEPYIIVDQTGFRISYKLTNSNGIDFKYTAVGFATESNFYVFIYRASTIHYFEAGLPGFETLLGSIRIAG